LDGDYHLVSVLSWKCMDAGGTPTFAGNPTIQQLGCGEAEEQSFAMTHVDAGHYTLTNRQTNACVAIEGGAADNSLPLVSVPCDGADAERWLPVPQEDKSLLLVNAGSGNAPTCRASSRTMAWACSNGCATRTSTSGGSWRHSPSSSCR
jgi:hypothetical protein